MVTSDTLFIKALTELSKIVLQNKKDIEALKKGGTAPSEPTDTVTTYSKSSANDLLNEALGTTGVEYVSDEGTDSDTKKEYSKVDVNNYLNEVLGTSDVEYVTSDGTDTIEEKQYTTEEANNLLNEVLDTTGETYFS